MYLVVGLGNHGDKFTYTRHNVGFLFADTFARQLGAHFSYDGNCGGELAEIRDSHEKYILLKPHTYMNRSGEAVARAMATYHIPPSNVIVISDDTNLAFGTTRIRFGGEAGGHNGLKSVIASIGSDFWRIRIGVGTMPERVPLEAWVLSALNEAELQDLHTLFHSLLNRFFTEGVHVKEETLPFLPS